MVVGCQIKQLPVQQTYLQDNMAQLDSSGLTFTSQPTKAETERFEYAAFGYFDNNPAIVGNTYQSFIGIYYDDFGNKTDDYSQYDYLYMLLNYVQTGYVNIQNQ